MLQAGKAVKACMFNIIDTEDQINILILHLDAMVGEGLIAVSRVDVIRYSRDPAATPRKPNES